LTEEIIGQVAEICEALGRFAADLPTERSVLLRRANRIRTVHASLAVEGNTLSLDQVEAVLEGRRVVGPASEIQEVRNALNAYEHLDSWDPGSSADLHSAHGVLMEGLVERPGSFRHGAAGIMGAQEVVHIAPPADRVPFLVDSLLHWLVDASVHPLVVGCVFHYEFEFIHPFVDCNGRLGRLWQTLILSRWNPVCAFLPVEHVIRDRQAAYYAALRQADAAGASTPFIAFMLGAIHESVAEASGEAADPLRTGARSRAQSDRVIAALKSGKLSVSQLVMALGLRSKTGALKRTINDLLAAGLIEYTIPEKPTSRLQMYRLTSKGRRRLAHSESAS
jgi:Fic family protein